MSVFLARKDAPTQGLSDGGRIESPDDIHKVGVFAQIYNLLAGSNDGMTLLLFPHSRVKIRELTIRPADGLATAAVGTLDGEDEPASNAAEVKPKEETVKMEGQDSATNSASRNTPAMATVETLREEPFQSDSKELRAKIKSLIDTLQEIVKLNPLVQDQMTEFTRAIGDKNDMYNSPGKLADFAAAMSDGSPEELQEILQSLNLEERLNCSLMLLKRELINAELQNRVSKDLERQIGDRDREYFLRERLRTIQSELGMETNSREKQIEKYKKKASKAMMPEPTRKVFDEVLLSACCTCSNRSEPCRSSQSCCI